MNNQFQQGDSVTHVVKMSDGKVAMRLSAVVLKVSRAGRYQIWKSLDGVRTITEWVDADAVEARNV